MGWFCKATREAKREIKTKGSSNTNVRRWFCLPFGTGRSSNSRIWHDPSVSSSPHLRPIRQFSLAELKRATHNFNNILADDNDNFTIYRAQLPHMEFVRVRRTNLENRGTLEQFLSELKVLSSVHHRNLVSLVGFCQEGGEHLLVYEHVEGTLSEYLHDPHHPGNPLSWTKRLDIALGVARGLSHLHAHGDPPIVHRNMKSSSILLNCKLVPKVSEVGLSRQMTEGTEQTRETQGYLPPEHYATGTCSDKSDVYAFGVVLLEILTGMKSFDRERFQHRQKVLLVDLVRSAYNQRGWRTVRRKVDPHIRNDAYDSSQKRFLQIAMDCLEEDRVKRPTMRDVTNRLEELVQRRPSDP